MNGCTAVLVLFVLVVLPSLALQHDRHARTCVAHIVLRLRSGRDTFFQFLKCYADYEISSDFPMARR